MSRGPRERVICLQVPDAPAATAMVSTGGVGTALLIGTVPADSPLVWPLVVLVLSSMAYDLGVRALCRSDR